MQYSRDNGKKYIIKRVRFFPLSPVNSRATKREQQSLKITDQAYEKWKQTEEINNFLQNQNNVFKIHNRVTNENHKETKNFQRTFSLLEVPNSTNSLYGLKETILRKNIVTEVNLANILPCSFFIQLSGSEMYRNIQLRRYIIVTAFHVDTKNKQLTCFLHKIMHASL